MLTTLKHKIYSLKKLWKWIPIMWHDRDWDYWYTLEILRQKLIDTEKYTREGGMHLHNIDDANKIRTAIRLIERVQEEYYIQEYYDTVDRFTMEGINKAIAKQDKAVKVLFKFLGHNIQKWWD